MLQCMFQSSDTLHWCCAISEPCRIWHGVVSFCVTHQYLRNQCQPRFVSFRCHRSAEGCSYTTPLFGGVAPRRAVISAIHARWAASSLRWTTAFAASVTDTIPGSELLASSSACSAESA
eukprot:COSAG01_NODE_8451_length_2781_cov_28.491424_4_plen_119_part_00